MYNKIHFLKNNKQVFSFKYQNGFMTPLEVGDLERSIVSGDWPFSRTWVIVIGHVWRVTNILFNI